MRILSIVVGAGGYTTASFRPLFASLKHALRPSGEVPAPEELPYTDPLTLNADWDQALLSRVEEAVA